MTGASLGVRPWIQRGGRRRTWLVGAAAMIGLAVLYAFVLRPVRPLLTRFVAVPVFTAVDTDRARSFDIREGRGGITVEAVRAGADGEVDQRVNWTAPPGVLFLLPALFLVAVFPTRPYWAYLLAYHVGLGVVQVLVFAAGLGWSDAMFEVFRFSQTYVSETVSLVVPALLYIAGSARSAQGPGSAPPRADAGPLQAFSPPDGA